MLAVVAVPQSNDWIVVAEWYGAERTVHGPTDLFDAVQWAARARKEED